MPTCAYEIDYFTITKDGALEFDDQADSEEIESLLEQLAERGFTAAEMPDTAADSGEEETFEKVSEDAAAELQGESVGCGLPVATSCEARSTDRVGRRDNRVDEAGAGIADRTWRSAGSAMEHGQHFHSY